MIAVRLFFRRVPFNVYGFRLQNLAVLLSKHVILTLRFVRLSAKLDNRKVATIQSDSGNITLQNSNRQSDSDNHPYATPQNRV